MTATSKEPTNQQNMNSNTRSINQQGTNIPVNYAEKLKHNLNPDSKAPSKKQAIILDNIEETDIEQYIYKMGDIIDPKHMTYASKIANNRICIYFDRVEVVDAIIARHDHITVNNINIPIRRLISTSSRIVISGGQPCVSNKQVEEELRKLGMKLETPVKPLRLGFKNDRFVHICGFKRHTFIAPDENNDYPDSFVIVHENNAHRFFLSGEMIKCKICKKNDHPTSKCPNKSNEGNFSVNMPIFIQQTSLENLKTASTSNITTELNIENIPNPSTSKNVTETTGPELIKPHRNSYPEQEFTNFEDYMPSSLNYSTNIYEDANEEINLIRESKKPTKRLASHSVSEESLKTDDKDNISVVEIDPTEENEETETFTPVQNKKKNKKSKIDKNKIVKEATNTEEMLMPLKKNIEENAEDYPISFTELIELIECTPGQTNKIQVVQEFTEDYLGLYDMLKELYSLLTHQAMKNRFTRLLGSLKSELKQNRDQDTCKKNHNGSSTMEL